MKPGDALTKLKREKLFRETRRYYIKMQRRGPSYMVNGKRVWPYDVIPILFHTEAEAWAYIDMRQNNLFINSGSTRFKKGKWKSACVEKVLLKKT